MAYNGVGVFNRIYNWTVDAANGVFVDSTRADVDANDIAAGLTNCVTRDGQSPPTANLPMGSFKLTGLASGSATNDSVNYGQVFSSPSFTTPSANVSPTGADNPLRLATVGMVNATAFSSALPTIAVGFLSSPDGVAVSFGKTHTGYAQNEVKGADIASAATINLTTATGNFVHVTGTTTITAITIPVGAERTVIFDGILTLTHGAALLLPSGANIVTAANDRMTVRGDTAGAIVTDYTKANGAPVITALYLKVSDQKSSGTSGGSSVVGEQTRTFNTTDVNEISGASLGSNTITLPAGGYEVWARAPSVGGNLSQARLYNTADSTYTIIGSSTTCSTSIQMDSFVTGKFSITASKTFQLKQYISAAVGNGLGLATSGGQVEVYSEAIFKKVS